MPVSSAMLLQAIELYLQLAYPQGAPAAAQQKLQGLRQAGDVPLSDPALAGILEKNELHPLGRAIRLGQPLYPHMKLAVDPLPSNPPSPQPGSPEASTPAEPNYLFRVDAHDRHLHAAPGSPDEAWLANVRRSNQQLVERIEAAWDAAGLPTFRGTLRRQLAARRAAATPPSKPP
ncbi:MAG TPA: hypothetical protein VH253_01700 [Phycisphaerae bacterium]|nr:hypothetical protein [Phycisphaerae bacterium]